jgi:hypothetical protein
MFKRSLCTLKPILPKPSILVPNCSACKHYLVSGSCNKYSKVNNNNFSSDYGSSKMYHRDARKDNNLCGVKGKYFESKIKDLSHVKQLGQFIIAFPWIISPLGILIVEPSYFDVMFYVLLVCPISSFTSFLFLEKIFDDVEKLEKIEPYILHNEE